MPSLDPAVAGYDKSWIVGPLVDDDGQPVDYSGGDAIDVAVARHDGATSPSMSAAWLDVAAEDGPTIALSLPGTSSTVAGPGDYRVRVGVTSGGLRSLAFDGTLTILAPSANPARLALESAIFGQFRGTLRLVGLEQVVGAETRALDLPIARSMAAMGLPPGSFAGVADADLERVPAYAQGQFHDLLEERVLGMVLSRWDGFDFTEGSESAQKLGALRDSIEKSLARIQKLNASRYTPGAIVPDPGSTPPVQPSNTLRAGSIDLRIHSRRRCYDEGWR